MAVNETHVNQGAQAFAGCVIKLHTILDEVASRFGLRHNTMEIWQDEYGPDFNFTWGGDMDQPESRRDPFPDKTPYDCLVSSRDLFIGYFEQFHNVKINSYRLQRHTGRNGLDVYVEGTMKAPKPAPKTTA